MKTLRFRVAVDTTRLRAEIRRAASDMEASMAKRTLEQRAVREHHAIERATRPTLAETGDGTLTPEQRRADEQALGRAEAILGADHGLAVVDRLHGPTSLPAVLAPDDASPWGLVAFLGHTGYIEPVALVFAVRDDGQPTEFLGDLVPAQPGWRVYADGRIASLADLGRMIEAWRSEPKPTARVEG